MRIRKFVPGTIFLLFSLHLAGSAPPWPTPPPDDDDPFLLSAEDLSPFDEIMGRKASSETGPCSYL